MYEDTYTEFGPDEFKYGHYKIHKISNNLPEIEWDYGDTTVLYFDFANQFREVNIPICSNVVINYSIYEFRGDKAVVEFKTDPSNFADIITCIELSKEDSEKLIPGNYYLQAVINWWEPSCINEQEPEEKQLTIIKKGDFWIHVR